METVDKIKCNRCGDSFDTKNLIQFNKPGNDYITSICQDCWKLFIGNLENIADKLK